MSKFAQLCVQYIGRSGYEAYYNAVITEGISRDNVINIGRRYGFPQSTVEAIANQLLLI